MEQSPKLLRSIIAAAAVLALLSAAGNALVIWYVKRSTPSTYDDSALVARIAQLESGISQVGTLLGEPTGETTALGTQLEELRALVAELQGLPAAVDALAARLDYGETIEQLSAAVAALAERPDYSEAVFGLVGAVASVEERLTALENATAALALQVPAAAQNAPYADSSFNAHFSELAAEIQQLRALLEQPEPVGQEPAVQALASTRIAEYVDGGVRLRVLQGDTIWDLSRRFQSPPSIQLIRTIMELNNISDPRKLRASQILFIPIP